MSKTTIMTRILQLVHEVLQKNIHVTKRDLFYTDVKLFEARTNCFTAVAPACTAPAIVETLVLPQDQKRSDTVLDDVACMLGCTRSSLNGQCRWLFALARVSLADRRPAATQWLLLRRAWWSAASRSARMATS